MSSPTNKETNREISTKQKSASRQGLVPGAADHEYVTGVKLAVVIVSVTLVAFLILLDTSIVATVSSQHMIWLSSSFQALVDD